MGLSDDGKIGVQQERTLIFFHSNGEIASNEDLIGSTVVINMLDEFVLKGFTITTDKGRSFRPDLKHGTRSIYDGVNNIYCYKLTED
jgi:hypothetical protein